MRTAQILNGRYRIEDRLGDGGMAVVWKAYDDVLDRFVAVKVLAGRYATDPAARDRVRSEAQAAARLWHPHVTSVFDYGEAVASDGAVVPYVVMELLPGVTLADRMRRDPLPVEEALRICSQVAAALAAAHEQQLVHRDVKPSNVMLTASGAKVVDFGLAAATGARGADEAGFLWGTPAYLAPERLSGDEVVAASDVYALGLLLYKALTNHLPWESETTTEMLRDHLYVEPAPLPPVPGLPDAVYDLCHRCLAKEPAARPSAADVATGLSAAAQSIAAHADRTTSTLPVRESAPAGATEEDTATQPVRGSRPPAEPAGTGEPDEARPSARRRRRPVYLLALVVLPVMVVATVALVWPVVVRSPEAAQPPGAGAVPSARPSASSVAGGNSSAQPDDGAAGGLGRTDAAQQVPGSGDGSRDSTGSAAGEGPGSSAGPAATGSSGPDNSPGSAAPSPPTSPEASNAPAGDGLLRTVLGGVVRVRCVGDQAEVIDVIPAVGFVESDESERGPADRVRIVLVAGPVESVVTATCRDGVPVFG